MQGRHKFGTPVPSFMKHIKFGRLVPDPGELSQPPPGKMGIKARQCSMVQFKEMDHRKVYTSSFQMCLAQMKSADPRPKIGRFKTCSLLSSFSKYRVLGCSYARPTSTMNSVGQRSSCVETSLKQPVRVYLGLAEVPRNPQPSSQNRNPQQSSQN